MGINSYDDWGIPAATNLGRFQYTGQIWLPELGMYYYKARIYSPTLGRFMQTDPIGYEDGMNMYAYVGNDPMNMGDPSGTSSCARVKACDGKGVMEGTRSEGGVKALIANHAPTQGVARVAAAQNNGSEGSGITATIGEAVGSGVDAASDAVDLGVSILDRNTTDVFEAVDFFRTVPSDAYETVEKYESQGYEWRAGQWYRAAPFENREGQLPSGGDYVRMFAREAAPASLFYNANERVVVDRNTGAAWYTRDKYITFIRIK